MDPVRIEDLGYSHMPDKSERIQVAQVSLVTKAMLQENYCYKLVYFI